MAPEKPGTDAAVQRFINISIEKVIKLHEAGYTNEAIAQFADILTVCPDNDEIIYRLARLLRLANRSEEAMPLLKRIDARSPYYVDSLYMLGMMLGNCRDFSGGVDCLTRLLEIDNSRVECYNKLARFLMELGRPDEAERYLRKSIQALPENSEAYLYLGNLFARYWRLGEAREQFQRVIELQPDHVGAYSNLSGIAVLEGNIDEAVSLLHTALKLRPNFRIAADNLLFNLNYSESYTPEQVRDEHLRLAALYNVPVQGHALRQHRPGRKIRIGYVSGDFRSHSVAFFLEPVLRRHNKDNVEIFCYDMVTVPDDTTRRMMDFGWTWRPVYGLSDGVIADRIKDDGIDILIDLAGHTLGNRLGVFALRPAPLQVTWLGYPNTTGLKQMDFRLTDELADPIGMTEHLYSETLIRLPRSFLCYAPAESAPDIAPLPEEPITFCCFNNYPKVSDTVLKLWARILHAVPGSKLLLKCGSLEDSHVRTLLSGRFAELGIDAQRLTLDRFTLYREEHLKRYGSCHVALDTYPYNGTTTTCEALWMGVPVVTLAGTTHASRVGSSILKNSGVPELIALNTTQYIDIAVALAKNPARLQEYRYTLRTRLRSSPLLDAVSFTADLEHAYLRMLDQLHD